jgi:hypothetical protein
MQSKPRLILGWLGVVNGAALLAVPRVLSLDDSFGDKARIFTIAGTSLWVIGLVTLLGISELGKGMGPKQSSVLRVILGIVLMLTGLSLSSCSLGKAWGFLFLPLALVSTVLMTTGLLRCRA